MDIDQALQAHLAIVSTGGNQGKVIEVFEFVIGLGAHQGAQRNSIVGHKTLGAGGGCNGVTFGGAIDLIGEHLAGQLGKLQAVEFAITRILVTHGHMAGLQITGDKNGRFHGAVDTCNGIGFFG